MEHLSKNNVTREPSPCHTFYFGTHESDSGADLPMNNPESDTGFYFDEGSFWGKGGYFFAGGNISIGFDIMHFVDELNEIY